MDTLDNDDFAASVFTRETALHSKQREAASGEDEKREMVAKAILHCFDTDHSNDIDALEFHEGMRMIAHDMERFARVCVWSRGWWMGGRAGGWRVGGRRVASVTEWVSEPARDSMGSGCWWSST